MPRSGSVMPKIRTIVPKKSSLLAHPTTLPGYLPRLHRLLSALAPALAARHLARLMLRPPRHPASAEEEALRASARPQSLYLEGLPLDAWNGKPMQLLRWGQARRGRVYVLHGWGGRATQFLALVPRLLEAGFEVVGIDAPAHGQSPGRQASVLHFAQALRHAVAACGPAEAVVAHSLGAAAAAYAVSQGLAVRALALIAAPLDLGDYSHGLARMAGFPEAVRTRMQGELERRLGVGWAELALPRCLGGLGVPGLIVHDRDDREVPHAAATALLAAWPAARLHSSQGLGHRRILRDAACAARIHAFIEGDVGIPRA